MNWQRLAENTLLSLITLVQVALCRVNLVRAWRPLPRPADAECAPILVIRCEAKLGDNLLNIPFLRALRETYPARPIHLLHHASARSIYMHCPHVDQRMEIDWPMSSPRTLLQRLTLCRKVFSGTSSAAHYGLALTPRWDEDLYAPFLAWMSGSPRRIGFSRRVQREKAWRNVGTDTLLTDAIDDRSVVHESRRPLRLLTRLPRPLTAPSAALEFWFSAADQHTVEGLMGGASDATTWVAIAPGAAIDRRKWPMASFEQVAGELGTWPDVRLLLVGSTDDAADGALLAARCQPRSALNVAGRLSLAETAAALRGCALFIGNDSGLLHLASAVGTRSLEISCHPATAPLDHPNSPARFGPTVAGSTVLQPPQPGQPACRGGCISLLAHCIAGVSPEAVVAAAAAALTAQKATQR